MTTTAHDTAVCTCGRPSLPADALARLGFPPGSAWCGTSNLPPLHGSAQALAVEREHAPAPSRGLQLDAIMRDLDTTGAAWVAAGFGYDTPEYAAREAVFARLHEWNAAAV